MTTPFRYIGAQVGPDPFAPKRRTLTSVEMLRALSLDPNRDFDHGGLRGILHRLTSVQGISGPTQEQRLIEWALQVEPKASTLPTTYENPARLTDGRRSPRALSPGDLEFVRSFEGAQPESVLPADVKLLAELEAVAESPAERRVVSRVLEPVRRVHDRKEEEAGLLYEAARHSPSGWRCATVRDAWEPVLAERLAEEARAELEPQLAGVSPALREKTLSTVEEDARREARSQIQRLWGNLDNEAAQKVNAARTRLSALALGADPVSSAPVRNDPDAAGIEEGRRRGREAREEREAKTDAFADFRRVG